MSANCSAPFLILALPRSRTFWLSQFLSAGEWQCGHEQARYMRGLDDVKSWLKQDFVGTVETTAAPFWRMFREWRPDLRIVTIRRPVAQVVESFLSIGLIDDREALERRLGQLDAKLDQIERRNSDVLRVDFAALRDEAACKELFEFCLPYEHNTAWWSAADAQNMQINLPALFRYVQANGEQLRLLNSLCAQQSKQLLWNNGKLRDLDGVTFQEQSFPSLFAEAQKLFSSHALAVGEQSNAILNKNLTRLNQLDAAGALQITTAKCNGRLLGYLITVLAPSIEDATGELHTAVQTMFYATPDAPGIGMRLQRAAIDALRERGGQWEVLQRAGVRGDGERLSALYRRMGAKPYGEMFKFDLEVS